MSKIAKSFREVSLLWHVLITSKETDRLTTDFLFGLGYWKLLVMKNKGEIWATSC